MKTKKFENIKPVIILDNGSGYIKVGRSNQKEPEYIIPSMLTQKESIPYYNENLLFNNHSYNDYIYGEELLMNKGFNMPIYPMSDGKIIRKEEIGYLWQYVLENKMKLNDNKYKEQKILISQDAYIQLDPADNKERIFEILFEKFNFEYAFIESDSFLSLYCEGKNTGIVIDSGYEYTKCISIYNNEVQTLSKQRVKIGGKDVTEKLCELLFNKGYLVNKNSDLQLIKKIKEKYCLVSYDINNDRKLASNSTFFNSYHYVEKLLPDKQRLFLSNEKFEAPEILFNKELNKENISMQELVYNSINNCSKSKRKELYKNIVASGGNTLFPGFVNRLESSVKNLYYNNNINNDDIEFNVSDTFRRRHSVFLGGCILANYYNNSEGEAIYWISKKEYDEVGNKKSELIKHRFKKYNKIRHKV